MIRYSLLAFAILGICGYAWKSPFRSMCLLLWLTAILQRPDMPESMFGIVGLNPWNLALAVILTAWMTQRGLPDERVKLPGTSGVWLTLGLLSLVTGFLRLLYGLENVQFFYIEILQGDPPTRFGLFIDQIVNSIKYALPAIVIFSGCRNEQDTRWLVVALTGALMLLAVQTIRAMPLGLLTDGDELSRRALRVLGRQIGYYRVDLSVMFASGVWGCIAARPLFTSQAARHALLVCSAVIGLALILTAGRGGYLTAAALALVFGALRWRKVLLVAPVVLALALMLVPAAGERILEGFADSDEVEIVGESRTDVQALTASRSVVWPLVVGEIFSAPLFGHGRFGVIASGASEEAFHRGGGYFINPHSAYLELLIDNGFLGALPFIALFFLLSRWSFQLFLKGDTPELVVVGGLGIAFIFGQLLGSVTGQSFYPREGVILMWAVIGLVLRRYSEVGAKIKEAAAGTVVPETLNPSEKQRIAS